GEDTLHPQMIHLLHKALRQGDFPLAMARWQGTEQKVAAMPELPRVAPLNLLTQRDLYLALTDRERGFVDVGVPWNKLYRRSVIGKLRFEGVDSEGSIFHTRLYRRVAYAAVVDQPLYYRRLHGGLPGRHLQDPSVGDRLLAYAQNAEEMAGTVYAPWYDVFLYRSMASALKNAHGSRYHDRVYQTVRTIFNKTARRLLMCRAVPFTECLRLLAAVFVRSYFR
ncbi:MAG: hypothetical protein IJV55_07950, partial [Paludibacteraceae bacterium]|nr:hypothetical protein [Paludibacteraceae bacterium]